MTKKIFMTAVGLQTFFNNVALRFHYFTASIETWKECRKKLFDWFLTLSIFQPIYLLFFLTKYKFGSWLYNLNIFMIGDFEFWSTSSIKCEINNLSIDLHIFQILQNFLHLIILNLGHSRVRSQGDTELPADNQILFYNIVMSVDIKLSFSLNRVEFLFY